MALLVPSSTTLQNIMVATHDRFDAFILPQRRWKYEINHDPVSLDSTHAGGILTSKKTAMAQIARVGWAKVCRTTTTRCAPGGEIQTFAFLD